jgi:hypothetical protein
MANILSRSKKPMSPLSRGCAALFATVGLSAVLWAPGCLPALPQPPAIQLAAPQLAVPAAPELQIPDFQPPEIQKPEGPELPVKPPEPAGNCCIRRGNLLKKECEGAVSCCIDKFEDAGECEEQDGFWFFSPEGCAGAC